MINPKEAEGSQGGRESWGAGSETTIAMGAQQTVVRTKLVEEEEYTGETIRLVEFDGKAE